MSEGLLPLFPLQVVLFPSALLPLHIFEERYKVLIQKCIAEGKEFGINLVQKQEVQKVGCTAIVGSVVQRYPDGRMDIIVQGRRRYALLGVDGGEAPYKVGRVRYLQNVREKLDQQLAAETVLLYNELVAKVYKNQVPQVEIQEFEPGLSFLLAQKAGMDLEQRQRLLENSSENGRLAQLYAYLHEVVPKLEHLEETERIIRSDGYLQQ